MALDLCRVNGVSWSADGKGKWSGATKRSRFRHPCPLPRPRRPRWSLGDGCGPVSSSAGSDRSVMAPLLDRRGV